MKTSRLLITACLTILMPFGALFAAPEETRNTEICDEGWIYDGEQKKCVRTEQSSLNDAELLDNAKSLARAERFDEALTILKMIENQQTAEVQNYLGFSSRKAGDVEAGLAHYRAALALDPDYTLARSYLGQALLNNGDREGALFQLTEIERLVGTEAREYKLLAASIEEAATTGVFRY